MEALPSTKPQDLQFVFLEPVHKKLQGALIMRTWETVQELDSDGEPLGSGREKARARGIEITRDGRDVMLVSDPVQTVVTYDPAEVPFEFVHSLDGPETSLMETIEMADDADRFIAQHIRNLAELGREIYRKLSQVLAHERAMIERHFQSVVAKAADLVAVVQNAVLKRELSLLCAEYR